MYVHIRCLVYCKLPPLHLHFDMDEIGSAAKRLGSLRSQPHAAAFDPAWKTTESGGESPHGFLDGIRGRQMTELNLDSPSVHDLNGMKTNFNSEAAPKRTDLLAYWALRSAL